MILYFAGNFPLMKSPKDEKALMNMSMERVGYYNRLGSFYFLDGVETLLKINKEIEDESKQKADNGNHSAIKTGVS